VEDVALPPVSETLTGSPTSRHPFRPRRGRSTISRLLAGAVGLGIVGVLTLVAVHVTAGAPAQSEESEQSEIERGAALFQYGCTSCHGTDAVGTDKAPSLVGVGAAAADFQLSTGRMPLASPDAKSVRKAPGYDQNDIDALVAYIASLGHGPAVPDVDLADADLAAGGVAYRANCAACHNAAGSGGALSYGEAAPPLFEATATQVVEAMRTGPGQMPVFGANELNAQDENNIALYVTQVLQHPDNRGGLPLGSTGPVPEGLLAAVVGLVVIGAALKWTVRSRRE
jgi:ubiquinol-cytochrome c reductase cytochrome c subunit